MATAQVKQIFERTSSQVVIVDRAGRVQWHEVFENNPKISPVAYRGTQRLINAGGVRPYIASKTPTHWVWKRWNTSPGELFFSDEEKAFGAKHGGRILIEPHTKKEGSNKAWLWERWQELVDRGGEYVQVGPIGTPALRGIEFVPTRNFRLGCAVLAHSRAFVGTEGGLHHAAAAVSTPAVVLFSEFISPDITGYPKHRNLHHAGGSCGMRTPCSGCRDSMLKISVDEVEMNLKEIL